MYMWTISNVPDENIHQKCMKQVNNETEWEEKPSVLHESGEK